MAILDIPQLLTAYIHTDDGGILLTCSVVNVPPFRPTGDLETKNDGTYCKALHVIIKLLLTFDWWKFDCFGLW